ncbi:probable polysaccharide biosynthesis protein [Pseudanabaena sp. lw0831]|uniref:lipopolysaccharide biosynthesis protein n=1 Tax=Pseudanabaena sp. lw0831 TaxID=1357935 RepID=UPI001915C5A0|nr:lipopolysaccharide biosynthesis protein [Pseudanabaena sp. lw0831]GBO54643.1 probable polysaccharide biosynthesis protein [Pseudanabaena sp. lw0831]
MSAISQLIDTLKQKLASRFLQNLGWLGLSELFIRISRLAATVILARQLSKYEYGLAALILTTNAFVEVFTQNGIWDKLIQADEKDIEELSQTAYCLNWIVCSSLFLIQCLISFPIAWFYHDNNLILPICGMAVVYLLIPWGLVQASLSQRENRLHVLALANGVQVSLDNVLTIILALCGLGIWAIILPKIIVGPIWVAIHYFNQSWRPKKEFSLKNWQEIIRFGRSVLGIKMMNTLRNNLDYLIAGKFLGVEALGIYYFAFNAGLGISMSAIEALDSALFPHLCAARAEPAKFKERYFSSFKTIAWIVVPLVLLQSSLAPIYVPIVFSSKWLPAIPILILICLSAIPRPFANAASRALWAMDKPNWDLKWNIFFTGFFAISLLIGVNWNIIGIAVAVLLAHWLALPIYTFWVNRYVRTL